jgi:hypothetical protein
MMMMMMMMTLVLMLILMLMLHWKMEAMLKELQWLEAVALRQECEHQPVERHYRCRLQAAGGIGCSPW